MGTWGTSVYYNIPPSVSSLPEAFEKTRSRQPAASPERAARRLRLWRPLPALGDPPGLTSGSMPWIPCCRWARVPPRRMCLRPWKVMHLAKTELSWAPTRRSKEKVFVFKNTPASYAAFVITINCFYRSNARRGKGMHKPAYSMLHAEGLLEGQGGKGLNLLENCRCVPPLLRGEPLQGELGFCRSARYAKVASFGAHFGEEAPLVGTHGPAPYSSAHATCSAPSARTMTSAT